MDMDRKEKLTQLVEQAALKVTLLTEPAVLEEINEFQEILNQIQTEAAGFQDISAETANQMKSLSAQALQDTRRCLQQQDADGQGLIESIGNVISNLSSLLENIDVPSSPQPATQTAAATATPVSFSEEDIPLLHDFVVESNEHIETAEKALLELEKSPDNDEVLNQIFRSFHTIKGMAGFLNLNAIQTLAHAAENLLDKARKHELRLTNANSDAAFAAIDMLKTMFVDLEQAIAKGVGLHETSGFDGMIQRLRTCVEQGSNAPAAALEPKQAPAAAEASIVEPVAAPDAVADQKLDTLLKNDRSSQATASDEKIKVSMQRLDELINMTGELAIAQLMIAEEVKTKANSDSHLFRKVALQNKIVRELQELSMSMRMVPIQGAFQRMSRLVRDLSHKAGKTVQFVTSGDETELDRNIVDKITDPLVHMMRNSVDHGLETPEERIQRGKNPQGRISLSAYHQAGSIVLEIADDGRGLNRDKILKKAIEKNLVSEGQDLSDDDIYRLIFLPGFSTADKISDVSGRGVGMDVVKKNISNLGGKIDIQSVLNQGTTFVVRLPLTLAIIDGQIVTVGSHRYIIPINAIVSSVKPLQEQISSIQNRSQVVLLRDELMPLVRLHELFHVEGAQQDPTQGLLVIVEEGERKCCLLVDDLLGQQQVVIKNLAGMGKIKGISGGAIMGDGLVSLILDVPGLIELSQKRTSQE
jgi:two-component system chemotaxis sensor kinase CheA